VCVCVCVSVGGTERYYFNRVVHLLQRWKEGKGCRKIGWELHREKGNEEGKPG